ncbi:hypothetical protein [Sphingomonas sp.]|uniref:hypothetical protein n=1 Tax=Sphingomonas sp. TaxID=28214 RepID=UPI00286C10E9|nr:hypothetical protein [Sphingomonas sp.]
MLVLRLAPIAILAAAIATPTSAAWQRATSTHFIIYADQDPAGLSAFAQKLERFDKAVRVTRAMADPPVGDGNRLTVFVVGGLLEVQRLQRGANNLTAGFYRTRASGSIAVVPRRMSRDTVLTPEIIFFHEYAHHLMFQELSAPYPPWFVEGFAEFMSTAEVKADGSVGLGGAPVHRARSLYQRVNPLPFSSMLGAQAPTSGDERAALYARGWLLAHYLTFSPTRRGQLEAYLSGIAAGRPPLDSARAAFGDLTALERDSEAYLKADKFPFLTIPAAQVPIAPVKVAPVSPGMAATMPLMMRFRAGTDGNDHAGLADRIRASAAPFPADPMVQSLLAEAELAAADPVAAEAAADRALAAQPDLVDAMLTKGRAILARAVARKPGASFVDARSWFTRANKVDSEDPEPLLLFYDAYRQEKVRPTANAIAALHYAADLAPQDLGLRLTNARQYLVDGKPVEARKALVPLAYYSHGGKLSDEARQLIGLIDSGQVKAATIAPATQ